ncbi:DUF47 family protein [Parvibaculum sp.]|uniref:DUF47 family protein n=1 Tax=Parvibaculum sp. TaxID=2024848 RepID=UPI00320C840F
MDELGERALLLPDLLSKALAANDGVKFLLTLLQTAERRADRPEGPGPDLSAERRAAGLTDGTLDRALADVGRETDGTLYLPGAAIMRQSILDGIATMRAPLALAGVQSCEELASRETALSVALPVFSDDRVPHGIVDAITSADRARGDSLHILVMDLHKALNALQGELSEESIDGARVWRIEDADRPLVAAFMRGLNETAPLKFDHPGLGTTATRAAGKLVIQNDIGTNDAHVLVIHVEDMSVTLTYTDIHTQRAAFFQSLFKPFGVRWDDTRTRQGEQVNGKENYYLCVGYYDAPDRAALERYLSFLGSRIVFLIDWNHTRKLLREFLPKHDGIRLLKWAAENNIGHRGFLKLGGERLLYDAIEFAQQALRYGEKLHEALGAEQALDYMKFVLRLSTEGLAQGRSERFIRDEVKTELVRRFHGAQESLLSLASAHAGLVFELATGIRDGLLTFSERRADLDAAATRAQHWEQEADALVSRVRSLVRRMHKPEVYRDLLHEADDAADALEEAAFVASFLPKLDTSPELLVPVARLADLLVEGAEEMVKMFEAAGQVRRDGAREDFDDFLQTVDRLTRIEHETDRIEREARGLLLMRAPDFRVLELVGTLARLLEEAADAMLRTALKLRDHLVNDVMAG